MKVRYFHKPLRNKNIDYRKGLFFVTIQVANNKSVLGAIAGERVMLNELGRSVQAVLEGLPLKYPELELGVYVIMPNHIHTIVTIHQRSTNKENHLGFLVGRFKGASAFVYGKFKRAGKVPDIGVHLWQCDYWEDLISSEEEYWGYVQYIRNNPKNWTRDRWGAVTTYMLGEEALLDAPKRAFVASQGYDSIDFVPRRINVSERGTFLPRRSAWCNHDAKPGVPHGQSPVLISTFTSKQERVVLRRALMKKQSIIHVCPQGIPLEQELSPEQQLALAERRLLFISPQPSGSTLNKKVATWCNEYLLRQAQEIWVGDISPNGMLDVLINALRPE